MKNSTLKIRQSFAIFIMTLFISFGFSQTTLSPGQVAITGFNCDNPDEFSFVLLTDVLATTEINFTDNGLQTIAYNATDEGIITWTADTDLPCATEITIQDLGSNLYSATFGTAVESGAGFSLSEDGDQILVFQGNISSASYIYAINFDSAGWFDADDANTTLLPAALTNGLDAINLGEIDNGTYDCSVTNDAAALLSAVSTSANWTLSNSSLTLGNCQYFCSSDTVDWCNLQWPATSTINFGDMFEVYGQVYEASVTDTPASQGAGITAWIGFSETDAMTTADFTSSNWIWIQANYNPACGTNCGTPENNDEYFIDIGTYIPGSGVYYYVSRFQYNGGPYSYGGYDVGGGDGFWDGTNDVSQVLTVNAGCTGLTTTWDGASWDNGDPDITKATVLNAAYDTSVDLPGSFSACSLAINAGTLHIGNGDFVEVNNDVTGGGDVYLDTQGSLVQHNSNGTYNVTGTTTLYKLTAVKQDWYYYTYWSSPVVGQTIAGAFPDTPADRRFYFDASQYLDADWNDIDDDANDWQIAAGVDVMTPGVGYAATSSTLAPYPIADSSTFIGDFNNGDVTVPIYYNAANLTSWNFVGNPYPSALDFDAFYAANSSVIDGAAYFWTQSLPPDGGNPGNEPLNFNQNDYAVYTVGSGGIAAANGNTPDQYIPSAQGFFVPALGNGNATFNNSMRTTGNNNNFYRLSSEATQKNKIWVDLTSNNGIFNQVLVAYVPGATSNFDGMAYDATRNLSSGTAAILYSTIENETRKFAIQGKNPESLDQSEVIYLGIKNTIDLQDTQFTISIADLEGDFMTNTPIYLVDNLLGTEQDLTQSDYIFTSTVGEFNDRLEIRFASTLSVDEEQFNNNQLIVSNTADNSWEVSTTEQSTIDNVMVYDLMGRELINLDSENKMLIHIKTNTLSQSVYIVKVNLSNGSQISKKVIKQ